MPVENYILARMSRQELMVSEDRADWFRSCLTYIALHEKAAEFANPSVMASNDSEGDDFWPKPDDWRAAYRPYVVKDGILHIPVFGVLLNRFPYQVGRYATGYAYLREALKRGRADGNVRGIAWIHDSPGGEVAGNFELADEIFNSRGEKPMRAFSAEAMYSASYSLGSAAGEISVTRTAGVGSIGVVTAHVDYSAMLEKEGLKITFIYAGKHKVDGNPYEKLAPEVKERIQGRIDRLYTIFCQSVARNRAIDEDDVRATEAATYTAEEAVEAELADRVGIFEEEIEAWTRGLDPEAETAESQQEEPVMSKYSQEQMDTAIADARREEQAKAATAASTASTEAATAAKTRITAIMGCAEAEKRPAAAQAAAMDTDMSLEQAKTFLAKLPEEKAETPADSDKAKAEGNAAAFSEHMAKDAPNVGAGADKGGEAGDKAKGNPLTSALTLAGGMKPKSKAA